MNDYRDQLHTLPTVQLLHDREYWVWELAALDDADFLAWADNSRDFYRFKLAEIDRVIAYRERLRQTHPEIEWPEAPAPDKERWAAIKAALDLAWVIAHHAPEVVFQQVGRRRKCRCPFPWHEDSEPSFTVFPDQHWFCFGCWMGGDIYAFVMAYYQLTFVEAVDALAKLAGIAKPPATRAATQATKPAIVIREGEEATL